MNFFVGVGGDFFCPSLGGIAPPPVDPPLLSVCCAVELMKSYYDRPMTAK